MNEVNLNCPILYILIRAYRVFISAKIYCPPFFSYKLDKSGTFQRYIVEQIM